MKRNYFGSRLAILILSLGVIWSCTYEETQPTDIISGNLDLNEIYALSNFENPTRLDGQITNRNTSASVSGAKITARLPNSEIKYTTFSKYDGSFSLYVEGFKNYIIYSEKEGFDKTYYMDYDYPNDSIISVSNSNYGFNIGLVVHDPTPVFKVNFHAIKYLDQNIYDLAFNGTNLIGSSYYYNNFYNNNGIYIKSINSSQSFDFFTCQDTTYWGGYSNSKTIHKVGQKNGNTLSSFYSQIPSVNLIDIETFGNDLWLLTSNQLFKVSTTGELLLTINFEKVLSFPSVVGIAHNRTHLFILQWDKNQESINPGYILYKLDPSTGKILSKGILPDHMDDLELQGLAFDNTNFWSISDGYFESDLVKFSIIE